MLEKPGGLRGCIGAVAKGAVGERLDAARQAASASARPSAYQVAAEDPRSGCSRDAWEEAVEETGRLDRELSSPLSGTKAYSRLLAVPRIGPEPPRGRP